MKKVGKFIFWGLLMLFAGLCVILSMSTGSSTPASTQERNVNQQTTTTTGNLPTPIVQLTNTPTPAVYTVGDRVESAGIALTLNSIDRKQSLSRFAVADDGGEFVLADFTIENVDRDDTPYNAMYFTAKDVQGIEYNTSIKGASVQSSLKAGDLGKGEKVRGVIVFEVPIGSSPFSITYEPMVILGNYKEIVFMVP